MTEYLTLRQLAKRISVGQIQSTDAGYRRSVYIDGLPVQKDCHRLGFICAKSAAALDGAENSPGSIAHHPLAEMLAPEHYWWSLNPQGIESWPLVDPIAYGPGIVRYTYAEGIDWLLFKCRTGYDGYGLPSKYFQEIDMVQIEDRIRAKLHHPVGRWANHHIQKRTPRTSRTALNGQRPSHPWESLFDNWTAIDLCVEGKGIVALEYVQRGHRAGAREAARYLLSALLDQVEFPPK